jgi:glyoxylase-like metal-dependent hydrolase (beta-lactamase superfamily II)
MSIIKSLMPNIYLVETHLEGYEDIDVQGAVIIGSRTAAVWDTLTHPRDMEIILPLLSGKPVQIIYSHADWDHIWGSCGLPSDQVIGHRICLERFAVEVPDTYKKMSDENPVFWKGITLVPPSITFEKELELDLGGMTLTLYHLPGHTQDAIVGFIAELGVLLGGDAIEDPFPVFNQGNSLKGWIEGLKKWAGDERVKLVVPSHGKVSSSILIDQNIRYLEGLIEGTSYIPQGLVPFYLDTHRENVENALKSDLVII